jgi:dihydrofolate reductase
MRKLIVVLGSGQLARYLLGNDLVDEWSLTIHPLLLGEANLSSMAPAR